MSKNAKAFQKLRLQFEGFSEAAMPALNKALAEAAQQRVREQFERGRDPDGKPWQPTKKGTRPLVDTSNLSNSFTVSLMQRGWKISTSVYYARMNQGARNMLPQRRRVGRAWSKLFREVGARVLRELTEKAVK